MSKGFIFFIYGAKAIFFSASFPFIISIFTIFTICTFAIFKIINLFGLVVASCVMGLAQPYSRPCWGFTNSFAADISSYMDSIPFLILLARFHV
jgi:hypothetical protein